MAWSFYDQNGKVLQGVLAVSIDTTELADDAVTSAKIADGAIVNADINASAVIAYSKLAALADGNILVGNGSNVATSVNPSGDVNVVNDGTFSISTGVIVNADVNTSAAIALSKLATTTASRILVTDGSGVITPSSVTTANLTDLTDTNATTLHSHAGGGAVTREGGNLTTATTSSNTATNGIISDTLSWASLAPGIILCSHRCTASAGSGWAVTVSGGSSVVIGDALETTNGRIWQGDTDTDGGSWTFVGPRLTDFQSGHQNLWNRVVDNSSRDQTASTSNNLSVTNAIPIGEIITITMRMKCSGNGSNVTMWQDELHVYSMATS
jgi:hypothetical protein